MPKFVYVIIILLSFLTSKSQHWDWVLSDTYADVQNIATDQTGNIYTVANIGSTSYFSHPALTSTMGGLIVTKHFSGGSVIWTKLINGISYATLSLDKAGNIYVTGAVTSATFCGSSNTIILPPLSLNYTEVELFIAKYDNNGEILWVKRWGYTNAEDVSTSIKTDLAGNSYITGISRKDPHQGGPASNNFVLKYDTEGNLLWSKSSNWQGDACAVDSDLDQNGNFYITGSFNFSAFFDSFVLSTNTSHSIFIVKYDTNGNIIWAKKDGTSYDEAKGISVDRTGNFYVTGSHGGPSSFGNIILGPTKGMFVAKYDSTGSVLWARHASQPTPGIMSGIAIGVNHNGCFVTGGICHGTATFNSTSSTITVTVPKLNCDIFVAQYDSSGNITWIATPGGTSGYESNGVKALATDNQGNCFISGGYVATTIFGATTLTTGGGFLAKIRDSAAVTTSLKKEIVQQNEFGVYPNPTSSFINISYKAEGNITEAEITIHNATGQCLLNKPCKIQDNELNELIDMSKYPRGIYFVQIVANRRKLVRKVVVD
jgi:hypothetical protein